GEGLGFEAAGSVAAELLLSSLVGLLLGQALRLVLPAERAGGGAPEAGGAGPAAPMLSAEGSPLAERGKKSTEENAFERQLAGGQDGGTRFEDVFTRSLALQGVVVLAILSSVFPLASFSKHYLGEWARMEPLMTCTFASCWCGHDTARRPQLLGALSLWTPVVLLPFCTRGRWRLPLRRCCRRPSRWWSSARPPTPRAAWPPASWPGGPSPGRGPRGPACAAPGARCSRRPA
ncbi:unnamed protein product, partial [Prorocentrum cordatum]